MKQSPFVHDEVQVQSGGGAGAQLSLLSAPHRNPFALILPSLLLAGAGALGCVALICLYTELIISWIGDCFSLPFSLTLPLSLSVTLITGHTNAFMRHSRCGNMSIVSSRYATSTLLNSTLLQLLRATKTTMILLDSTSLWDFSLLLFSSVFSSSVLPLFLSPILHLFRFYLSLHTVCASQICRKASAVLFHVALVPSFSSPSTVITATRNLAEIAVCYYNYRC